MRKRIISLITIVATLGLAQPAIAEEAVDTESCVEMPVVKNIWL